MHYLSLLSPKRVPSNIFSLMKNQFADDGEGWGMMEKVLQTRLLVSGFFKTPV